MRALRRLTHPASLCLLALSAVGACTCDERASIDAGIVDAGPLTLLEREPNDGPAQALSIERSTLVEANLGADASRPDEDWYLLKAGIPQTVDLVASCPPGADLAIEVMDETTTVLASSNNGGVSQSERLPNLDVLGRAWVRIIAVKRGAGGAYTLRASYRDRVPGFELEPNDRKVDATAVPLGQAVSGFLGHINDADWYRYELVTPSEGPEATGAQPTQATLADGDAAVAGPSSADGERPGDAGSAEPPRLALRLDVSPVEGVSFSLQVLTEAEAVLFSAKSKEGAGLSLRNFGARATDRVIYVAIRSAPSGKEARRGFNAQTYYTLTVAPEERAENSEYEPNDDASKATELRSGGTREGFLAPKGDVDYYRLSTDGPSLAKLQVSGVERVDLQLAIVRPVEGKPEETVLKVNEGGVKEGEVLNNVQCDGSCLLRIEAAPRRVDGVWVREDENADQPYRLSVTVVPDDGAEEREPNSTGAQASPLAVGKPIRGTVYPQKDVDYFQLDLRAKAVKTPITATLLGVLKVDVGLYLHRVEGDGKLTLVQTSDTAKGDRPEIVRSSLEPGLYVLEVRDARGREANFQDSYQLTVEETGE